MKRPLLLSILTGLLLAACADDASSPPTSTSANNSSDNNSTANNSTANNTPINNNPANNNPANNNPAPCEDGAPRCGDACCGADARCEDGACVDACPGARCGAAQELCCAAEEVCYAEACVTPGAACARTEECAPEERCEVELGRCLPRANLPVCEFRPSVGVFTPRLGCRWTPAGLSVTPERGDVVATPVIGNLTDDNGDGRTDTDDIPDIAFLTYDLEGDRCCNAAATLRIVHGACNPDGTLRTLASLDFPPMDNSAGIALADLDGDGVAEIIAPGLYTTNPNNGLLLPQGVMAWRRVSADGTRWSLLWENTLYPTWDVHTRGGSIVSVADLHGDGTPEVIIGNVVLNGQNGALLWDGVLESGGTGGRGNNAFLGPYATVADLDLDGAPEILAGNTAYSRDGQPLWTFDFGPTEALLPCGAAGGLTCDGFTAAANFDDDPEGEVVIVRQGEVFILEHDGTLRWRQAIPVDDCGFNESGPPTIADFDGDGQAEIGTAAADFYAVLDLECDADPLPSGCEQRGVRWLSANQDCSSRVTASSVFDFEGDGRAEMIYADEANFRIFDGLTGALLFDDPTHGSHTRIEMPVIADVDNDGNAEVIIPENASQDGIPGVEIWEDAADNWVRTRRIWNQHAYSVTNINEDGTVPRYAAPNWSDPRLNNFRQNVQPSGLFDAPDLTVRALRLDTSTCGVTSQAPLEVTVANIGALGVPPGVQVRVFALHAGGTFPVADLTTTQRLLPGQQERLQATWTLPPEARNRPLRLYAEIDPDAAINECIEDNNALEQAPAEAVECRDIG